MSDGVKDGDGIKLGLCPEFGGVILKANLSEKKVSSAILKVTGCKVPKVRSVEQKGNFKVCWMSFDEVMILSDYDSSNSVVDSLKSHLAGRHYLCENVSDSRSCFEVSGAGWRDVIAKGSPSDLSKDNFDLGKICRTRIGGIAAAFWMIDENRVNIICFRSVEDFMMEWLKNASKKQYQLDFYINR